eukprot:5645670-Amphidinium_carterae.1
MADDLSGMVVLEAVQLLLDAVVDVTLLGGSVEDCPDVLHLVGQRSVQVLLGHVTYQLLCNEVSSVQVVGSSLPAWSTILGCYKALL